MQQARLLGYRVRKIAEVSDTSIEGLCEAIGCTEIQFNRFLQGRAFISFEQLSIIAKMLRVNVSDLLVGDEKEYEKSLIHCEGDFSNPVNREKILDIIDAYMDICDSLA